jgi:hypothetical protein
MTIRLLDPTGRVAQVERREELPLDALHGKRVGYIFNQHKSGLAFWAALEQEIERKYKPASVYRIYKENTWAPAPRAEMERLIAETDYTLVGLAA